MDDQATSSTSVSLEKEKARGIEVIPGEFGLQPELREAGVERIGETIEIPSSLKEIVKPSGSAVPLTVTPTVTLPLTDDQIIAAQKKSVFEAISWLGLWCRKQLLKLGIHLKKIHGKIVRVKAKE